MKVAIVLLAIVAVVAAAGDYYNNKQNDYYHAPHYKFDWVVKDDYYNDFGQYESREGDHTKGNMWVYLPGKQSYIKNDYDINAYMISSHGGYQNYGKNNYQHGSGYKN